MESTKEAYIANMGNIVKVGRYECEVCSFHKEGRSGTWATGFKFTSSTYGYLKCKTKTKGTRFSFDHGASWSDSFKLASKVRKGKILLERKAPEKELAYNAIQAINAQYY